MCVCVPIAVQTDIPSSLKQFCFRSMSINTHTEHSKYTNSKPAVCLNLILFQLNTIWLNFCCEYFGFVKNESILLEYLMRSGAVCHRVNMMIGYAKWRMHTFLNGNFHDEMSILQSFICSVLNFFVINRISQRLTV